MPDGDNAVPEKPDDRESEEAHVYPLVLGTSLNEKALKHLKIWARSKAGDALEVLDKRVLNTQSAMKRAPKYLFQKRSFGLRTEVIPRDDLSWLNEFDVKQRRLSLYGNEEPVSVTIIPEELAKQRPSLVAFIYGHLHELEGSAPYKALDDKGQVPAIAIGFYYPRLILMSLDELKDVLGKIDEVPPQTLQVFRIKVDSKYQRFREVILDDAPFL